MTSPELDLLAWLAAEQRPVSHLVAMSCAEFSAWVRAHGGRMRHIDAVARIRDGLRHRLAERLDRAAAGNIVRLHRL